MKKPVHKELLQNCTKRRKDEEITSISKCCAATVQNTRQKYLEKGFDKVLKEKHPGWLNMAGIEISVLSRE
ncbi:MAG: hypothetical protein P0S93_01345 [Candidatus Neptunochlamydia sp.]|nr:hypothetical protein [Candidatus Neptunochlamydia sp.]